MHIVQHRAGSRTGMKRAPPDNGDDTWVSTGTRPNRSLLVPRRERGCPAVPVSERSLYWLPRLFGAAGTSEPRL
jgi:hypothetical protein